MCICVYIYIDREREAYRKHHHRKRLRFERKWQHSLLHSCPLCVRHIQMKKFFGEASRESILEAHVSQKRHMTKQHIHVQKQTSLKLKKLTARVLQIVDHDLHDILHSCLFFKFLFFFFFLSLSLSCAQSLASCM